MNKKYSGLVTMSGLEQKVSAAKPFVVFWDEPLVDVKPGAELAKRAPAFRPFQEEFDTLPEALAAAKGLQDPFYVLAFRDNRWEVIEMPSGKAS